jgi:hypothetical protein
MKDYTIFFEIFGKKLKVTVLAENEASAKQAVLDKVKFHKVEVAKTLFNDSTDFLEDFLKGLKPKF